MPEHTPAPTPSRAVYGLAMYFGFKIFSVLYLIWAIVPETFFKSIGITCIPDRYWAISVPIFLLTVLTIFLFIIYPSLGLCMTPHIDDLRTIKDEVGTIRKNSLAKLRKKSTVCEECSCTKKDTCWKQYYDTIEADSNYQALPVLRDLNMWDVSRHIYLK